MKTIFRAAFAIAMITVFSFNTQATAPVHQVDPGVGEYAIAIPETLNTYITKETVDNSVRYLFKKSDGTTQFLFAVTKVSEQQWMLIKDQLTNATMQAHKNGFIYYVERTDKSSLKGADKDSYANVYNQLDAIVRSIDVRG